MNNAYLRYEEIFLGCLKDRDHPQKLKSDKALNHLFKFCIFTLDKMKIIATILLFIICSLTVQPMVASVCKKVKTESCCKKETKSCCTKKDKKSCKKDKEEGNCCGSGTCTMCGCCCFVTTVEKGNFSFARNSENTGLHILKNKNSLSGFLSSPFQPPEFC